MIDGVTWLSGGLKYLLERGRGARQSRPMTNISIGRIVHYVLSAEDADKINRRRTTGPLIAERMKLAVSSGPEAGQIHAWPAGAQAHIGNTANVGQEYPAMCVGAIVTDGDDIVDLPANLQVFLDGNDVFWATSRHQDRNTDKKQPPTPGTWHWPVQR